MSTSRVALFLTMVLAASALAQAPPSPSPAKRAIDERKAVFTLIGSNFRPIGEHLQGRGSLDANEARKRTERLAFLSTLAGDAFSEASNVGEAGGTRAKAEIWSRRADFGKALADFAKHCQALAQIAPGSDAFKSAAGAVAQDCKSCHDTFRSK